MVLSDRPSQIPPQGVKGFCVTRNRHDASALLGELQRYCPTNATTRAGD